MQHDKPQSPDPKAPPDPGAKPPPALDLAAFLGALRPGARLIGIDVGSKTLGLALSDVGRSIASGLDTIRRTKFKDDAQKLLAYADGHGVGGFVIGLPLNMDGSEGPSAQSARAFQRNLARLTDRPMLFWDERLSTAAAERTLIEGDASRRRRAEVIDKMAATIILQTAMDRIGTLIRQQAAEAPDPSSGDDSGSTGRASE